MHPKKPEQKSPKLWTILGDPHIKPSNLEISEKIFSKVEEMGNDVICLGDVLDTKNIINGKCLNFLYDTLKNSKLRWIILVGNHDHLDAEGTDYSLRVLTELSNVLIVDKPTIEYSRNCKLMFLPYYRNVEEFRTKLKLLNRHKESKYKTVLFIHQGVNGFDYGNGVIAQNEANLEDLSEFDQVISGHFHKNAEEENLVYVGTPFSHSFGESNQIKYLYTMETLDWDLEKVEITDIPKHITVEVDCAKADKLDLSRVKTYDFLRLILVGKEQDVLSFKVPRHPNLKVIKRFTDEDLSTVDELKSNEQQFLEWASQQELRESVVRKGVELIRND